MAGRQDREGDTQAPRRGAQEGPGRQVADLNGAVVLLAGAVRARRRRRRRWSRAWRDAMRDVLLLTAPTRERRDSAHGVGAVIMRAASTIGLLGLAPIVGACCVAGDRRQRRPGRHQAHAEALKPDFKRLNPVTGLQEHLRPERLVERRQEHRQGRRRRRDRRAGALLPQPRRLGRAGRHRRRGSSAPQLAEHGPRHRPARRVRLPR